MKLTSGFNFENYEITDYLGFCSGEYALNTKFLSDFNLLSSYSEKLEEAQKNALDILINNAKQMGADAIIGLDIDYTTDDHRAAETGGSHTLLRLLPSQVSL